MTPVVEGVTHIAAIVFYIAAFTMALFAHMKSNLWARKLSTVGMMFVTLGWLFFYLCIANLRFTDVHTSVLWSRVFHYNTATWIFVMAMVLWRSERYDVAVKDSRLRELRDE